MLHRTHCVGAVWSVCGLCVATRVYYVKTAEPQMIRFGGRGDSRYTSPRKHVGPLSTGGTNLPQKGALLLPTVTAPSFASSITESLCIVHAYTTVSATEVSLLPVVVCGPPCSHTSHRITTTDISGMVGYGKCRFI